MVLKLNRKPYFADLPLKELVLDKQVQMRTALNRTAIVDYAEAMERGDKFPSPVVFWIPGQKKYVADGFHRILAYKRNGVKTVKCLIRTGTKRDAILFAAGANRTHGVRRTLEDRRKAVLTFLGDKQWCAWADSVIARHAAVSPAMVSRYRKYLGESAQGPAGVLGEQRSYERNGQTQTMTVMPKEDKMESVIRGENCPYCGQKINVRKRGKKMK